MLAAFLIRMPSYFTRNINCLPKTKILTSKNLVILNQAFLCTVNKDEETGIVKRNHLSVGAFYHKYLLSNSNYINFLFPQFIKWIQNSKTAKMLNQVDQKGENNVHEKDLKDFSDYLDRELNHFTFIELCELIFLIAKYLEPNSVDSSWDKILQSINEQCLVRLSNLTVDELIIMLNVSLGLPQYIKFRNKLFYKLMKKCSTSHEVVTLFYFFIRKRILVPKEYIFQLQLKTLRILPEISPIEAAIIAEGFCNSFERLQIHDIHVHILQKAVDGVENIEEIPFHSFCKFSKLTSNISLRRGLPEFQKTFIKTALKFGVKDVVQLARSGENARYLDSDLRDVLMKEVKDQISQLPLFYIERVACLTTIFNIHDEEFLKLALDAFKTEKFTEKTKRLFLLFLKHLVCYKMYPKNVIDSVLWDESFVNPKAFKMHLSSSVWWFIYCSLEVEQPGYLTFDLAPNYRKRLFQVNKGVDSNKCPKHYLTLLAIKSVLAKHFGEGIIKHFLPLPHYPLGLLMRFDRNLKPQMLPEEFLTLNKSYIIKPLKDDHIWMFITVVRSTNLADPSTCLLNFIFQTQIRQLNAVGYVVLPVFKKSLKNFSPHNSEAEYLVNLINTKLEECCKDQKCTVRN